MCFRISGKIGCVGVKVRFFENSPCNRELFYGDRTYERRRRRKRSYGRGDLCISRIAIEEGFLDGIDIAMVPGLNVIIGARGTGKTSLIELVRFCLGIKNSTPETQKRSREHALSVLGSGQVTVTLSTGLNKITVSRTASDSVPRASGPYQKPIIFSQTEIETLGLKAAGRLQLLDGFIDSNNRANVEESDGISQVRSFTTEVEALRREIEDFSRQIIGLKVIDEQLELLMPNEKLLNQISVEAASQKQQLDQITIMIAATSVALAAVQRFSAATEKWRDSLNVSAKAVPTPERWPPEAGTDLLLTSRNRLEKTKEHLRAALSEMDNLTSESTTIISRFETQKLAIEERARQLRKELEASQVGAGTLIRQGQQLREKKAQLESLRAVVEQREAELQNRLAKRDRALDILDDLRERRFELRSKAAEHINAVLGPRIHVAVTRTGQFEAFASAITDVLRGSGMRYVDLSALLAEQISPRELLEATDTNDIDLIAAVANISKERSGRLLATLREGDLGF